MIDRHQFSAFSAELQKHGAHPYAHGAGALLGGGLAGYALVPRMVSQHERDLRDTDIGAMTPEVLKKRDSRRLKQTAALIGAGTVAGGLSPFLYDAGVAGYKKKLRPKLRRTAKTTYEEGKVLARDAARETAREAAEGASEGFKEHARELGSELSSGFREGFKKKKKPAAAPAELPPEVRKSIGRALWEKLTR